MHKKGRSHLCNAAVFPHSVGNMLQEICKNQFSYCCDFRCDQDWEADGGCLKALAAAPPSKATNVNVCRTDKMVKAAAS